MQLFKTQQVSSFDMPWGSRLCLDEKQQLCVKSLIPSSAVHATPRQAAGELLLWTDTRLSFP